MFRHHVHDQVLSANGCTAGPNAVVEEGLAWPLPPNRTPQPGRPRQLYRLIVEKLGPKTPTLRDHWSCLRRAIKHGASRRETPVTPHNLRKPTHNVVRLP